MSKKILVVIDVQKDFYHPNGTLYVHGGNTLIEKLTTVMPLFDDIVFTVDWHPANHCSFTKNGGQWPVHCVAYTEGATLPDEFMPYFDEIHDNVCRNIIMKGSDSTREEYGANANAIMIAQNENPEETEFVFCGIAGDYCVKETVDNFIKKFPDIKVSVYTDGTVSLDGGMTLAHYMMENNIPSWTPDNR